MKGIKVDPQSTNVSEWDAIVFAPRRQRKRFAENCVTVMDSPQKALLCADKDKELRTDRVLGPSRSS